MSIWSDALKLLIKSLSAVANRIAIQDFDIFLNLSDTLISVEIQTDFQMLQR